jgi:VWFA-related protein
MTGLYDSLARVSRDLSTHAGKKVIILFTDGADNSSAVTVDAAVRRAKIVGAPVHSIAQGDALRFPDMLKLLHNVSSATGALSYSIKEPAEIRRVFEAVANDLKHGYLLTFRPDMSRASSWRKLEVRVTGGNYQLRAREGYFAE